MLMSIVQVAAVVADVDLFVNVVLKVPSAETVFLVPIVNETLLKLIVAVRLFPFTLPIGTEAKLMPDVCDDVLLGLVAEEY